MVNLSQQRSQEGLGSFLTRMHPLLHPVQLGKEFPPRNTFLPISMRPATRRSFVPFALNGAVIAGSI